MKGSGWWKCGAAGGLEGCFLDFRPPGRLRGECSAWWEALDPGVPIRHTDSRHPEHAGLCAALLGLQAGFARLEGRKMRQEGPESGRVARTIPKSTRR